MGATVESGEPYFGSGAPGPTVWWSWRWLGTSKVTVQVQGTSFSPGAAVFRGANLSSLQLVAATTDYMKPGILTFEASYGIEYFHWCGFEILCTEWPVHVLLTAPALVKPPLLAIDAIQRDGSSTLTCENYGGGTVMSFASNNLMDWEPISTNTVPMNGQIVIPDEPGQSQRLYRARFW